MAISHKLPVRHGNQSREKTGMTLTEPASFWNKLDVLIAAEPDTAGPRLARGGGPKRVSRSEMFRRLVARAYKQAEKRGYSCAASEKA